MQRTTTVKRLVCVSPSKRYEYVYLSNILTVICYTRIDKFVDGYVVKTLNIQS